MKYKRVLVFHEEGFQLPAPSESKNDEKMQKYQYIFGFPE